MPKILIVDDEAVNRKTLTEILEFEKYTVVEATDGLSALAKIKKENFDVVLMDIKMPKMDGLEALERIQIIKPELPVVMISGHGTIEAAVHSVKLGAFDYISKPPDLNRMLITLRNAIDKSQLIEESKTLKRQVSKFKTQEIIGESNPIKAIKAQIDKVAPSEARVLVTGQNGTGKELVARWLHEKSNRNKGPMVEVNCAAIPSELIESELFGHEKGSFTGAHKQKIGKIEQANGGTIFLDEIGDMSLSAQAKVLRALQENRISRVGGDKEIRVDVRVVAATNKNLRQMINEGKFREDLYHRLAVILIHVPPLNQRRDDIPLLVEHFVENICKDYGIAKKNVADNAIEILKNNDWTGNIRELRNVVERLIILSAKEITKEDVENNVNNVGQDTVKDEKLRELIDKFEDMDALQRYIDQEFPNFRTPVNK